MFTKVTYLPTVAPFSFAPEIAAWKGTPRLGLTTWFSQVLLHLYAEVGFKNHR